MNLSFAGCGFLGIYHVGVAVCFKKYAPQLLLDKISGASAGAIAACCLLCDLPLGDLVSDVLRVVQEARSKTLGPFSPSFNVQNLLLEGMEKVLPEDAHLRVNGKLHISLTRVSDGNNVIVSQFDTKEDLQQALLASCFIPFFSGFIPPLFHGVRYMDGGFSNNLPTLDENTIIVSPFCGENDICPRDNNTFQLYQLCFANTSIEISAQNLKRITRILFPSKPEDLADICQQGFNDALSFLHKNKLLSCTRCLSVQSTIAVSQTPEESLFHDPECPECILSREDTLPATLRKLFDDAILLSRKGLFNWLYRYKGVRLLSVLTLPYILPADIMYATVTKFLATAPDVGNNLWHVGKYFLDQFGDIIQTFNKKQQKFSANISCHLAYTQYGGNARDVEAASEPFAKTNNMNINISVDMDQSIEPHASKPLSKWPSMSMNINKTGTDYPLGDDTFETVLKVTSQHDNIMTFYYKDENNKVKMTEIYDVTDVDTSALLSPEELENNTKLEFDDDWNEPMSSSTWASQHTLDGDDLHNENHYRSMRLSEVSYDEDYMDFESELFFSDPESEWNNDLERQKMSTSEIRGEIFSPRDSLPESDQQPLNEDRPSCSGSSQYLEIK